MAHPTIEACPFCGSVPSLSFTSSSNEQNGYNFEAVLSCCIEMSEPSKHDKTGWCKEGKDPVAKRLIVRWNKRHG